MAPWEWAFVILAMAALYAVAFVVVFVIVASVFYAAIMVVGTVQEFMANRLQRSADR